MACSLYAPQGGGWGGYRIQWMYVEYFPLRWIWLTQEASQASLLVPALLREKRRGRLSCWLTIFCPSTCPLFCPSWASLNLCSPYSSLGKGLIDLTFKSCLTELSNTSQITGCWTGTRRTRTAERSICSEQVFKCLVLRECGMAGPVMGPPSQLQHRAGGWQEPTGAGRGPVQGPGHTIRA